MCLESVAFIKENILDFQSTLRKDWNIFLLPKIFISWDCHFYHQKTLFMLWNCSKYGDLVFDVMHVAKLLARLPALRKSLSRMSARQWSWRDSQWAKAMNINSPNFGKIHINVIFMIFLALPFFHDSVYYLRNPGDIIDSVSEWPGQGQELTLNSGFCPRVERAE